MSKKPTPPNRIEITSGWLTWASIRDANGTRPDFEALGTYNFTVELFEEDGVIDVLFSGVSYERALLEAEEIALEERLEVFDYVFC